MANVLAIVSFKIYPPEMGGQKGVAEFYRYLAKHHHVYIACSKDNAMAGENVFPILENNRSMPLNILLLKQLSRLIQHHNIQCIIAEHSYTGWLAYRLGKKLRLPWLIHNHNIESSRFKLMHRWWWSWYKRYEQWIYKKADHLFFISDEDAQYASKEFDINSEKVSVVTYGIEQPVAIPNAGHQLRRRFDIDDNEKILYFNGTMDYLPNTEGMLILLNKVLPLLDSRKFSYKLIISGKRVPKNLMQQMQNNARVVYAGYVEAVNLLYQGADVFVNPVINHSGVKTKLVEALANGSRVVSCRSGASGIRKDLTGDLMTVVEDFDWENFAAAIVHSSTRQKSSLPSDFIEFYSWDNQVNKAAAMINKLVSR